MRETLVSPLHSTLHINSFLDFETEFATFSTFSQDCLKCGPRIWGFRTENRRRNNRPKSLQRSPVVGDFYGTGVERFGLDLGHWKYCLAPIETPRCLQFTEENIHVRFFHVILDPSLNSGIIYAGFYQTIEYFFHSNSIGLL